MLFNYCTKDINHLNVNTFLDSYYSIKMRAKYTLKTACLLFINPPVFFNGQGMASVVAVI